MRTLCLRMQSARQLLFRHQLKGAAALLLPKEFSNMNITAKRLSSFCQQASMSSERYPSGYTAKSIKALLNSTGR